MFKSSKQRAFMFAMDKDKQKGINPMEAKSMPGKINTNRPSEMIKPLDTHNLGLPKPVAPHSPNLGSIKPTTLPSLPGLQKMPRFPKLKKYLKKSF